MMVFVNPACLIGAGRFEGGRLWSVCLEGVRPPLLENQHVCVDSESRAEIGVERDLETHTWNQLHDIR
jgi:hypothetical protein